MNDMARVDRGLAAASATGVGFFVVTAALLPIVQAGHYDIVRQAISELALGTGGWLLNTGFVLMGVGAVCLAAVLRRTTGARVGPILLALVGPLDVVSATFHATRFDQPPDTAAVIHMVAGITTFLITILAIFAMVQPFSRISAWRRFSRPTLVWACVSAGAFVGLGPGVTGVSQFGLNQRAMAVTFLTWMLTTAFLAFRRAGSPESAVRLEKAPAAYSGGHVQ